MMIFFTLFVSAVLSESADSKAKSDCPEGLKEFKKGDKKKCAKPCGAPASDGDKGKCEANHVCVSQTEDKSYTQEKQDPVEKAGTDVAPTTFCKLLLPRCAKSDDAQVKCATEGDTCVKVTDGKTECDAGTTKSDACFCKPKATAPAGGSGGAGETGGLGGGAIAGIVIGSLVGVAALAVGGYFLYKHCSKKSKRAGKANKKPKKP